jgi:xylulose-5-phosphate/fructose-6-phosphate phosphoketolase
MFVGATPYANGGVLRRALRMPDFRKYGVEVTKPGQIEVENTRPLGVCLRDIMQANMATSGRSAPMRTPRTS